MKVHLIAATAGVAVLMAGSAAAIPPIYSNGAGNGTIDSFTINFGFEVANSFTAHNADVATGMGFETWDFSGATPTSVDWVIANGNPLNGGTVIASGTSSVTSSFILTNGFGYDLYSDTIALPSVTTSCGGNCWVELLNATDSAGNPVFWDENNGPSNAWDSALGNLRNIDVAGTTGSETFDITGLIGTPEPATWALMLAGFAGLGAMMRTRRRVAAA